MVQMSKNREVYCNERKNVKKWWEMFKNSKNGKTSRSVVWKILKRSKNEAPKLLTVES